MYKNNSAILFKTVFLSLLTLTSILVQAQQQSEQYAPSATQLATSTDVISGSRTIDLVDKQGNRFVIGRVVFSPEGNGYGYQLTLDHHQFTDHFLSMKEMKCLEGAELWCHIPFPYPNPHTVSRDDLRWLEHDLLFLFKRHNEFGANFWNGIYYRLSVEEGRLVGEAQAIDLNILASPADDLTVPPVGEFDREEADLEKRWLPRLEIY
ncbi:MAG: hypothetical protein V7707_11140 [Motiliproteus sp.]